MRSIFTCLTICSVLLTSCERDMDIVVKANKPQLVVEAYINNELPDFTYVSLSRSQDYFAPNLQALPVTGATVTITEGSLRPDNSYEWNKATTVQLRETRVPSLANIYLPGVYFDTNLVSNPQKALKGTPGKHYLLEIETAGKRYAAITAMLQPIPVDSVTSGNHFVDDDDTIVQTKARITVHYKDPDSVGNTQLHFWQDNESHLNFGWGGMGTNRFVAGTDDLVNGEYIRLTHYNGFVLGDTVRYYMAAIERKVYNFWDTFNKARNNEGPFATPVTLQSTIGGEDVIGCFSGFSISTKTIIVK
jgi:hypothetical protein